MQDLIVLCLVPLGGFQGKVLMGDAMPHPCYDICIDGYFQLLLMRRRLKNTRLDLKLW